MRVYLFVISTFSFFLVRFVSAQDLFESKSDSLVNALDSSYQKGLRYLSSTQEPNGLWTQSSYGDQAGVLGICILAFISRGDDPEFGPYAEVVRKSLHSMLEKQDSETGFIGTTMYNHGFATLALAELYGTLDDKRIGPALKNAVSLSVRSAQVNPKGAWRYKPDSRDADTTVSGTVLVSLFAARNAGMAVPQSTINKAVDYITNCQDTNGGIGYSSATGPNLPRTSIASLVFSLSNRTQTSAYKKSLEYLKENAKYGDQGHKFYSLYYTAQALFRAGPSHWEKWNTLNIQKLVESQQKDGSWRGNHGMTFSTAAALLSMALNYRYLPIYER
jgi:hypothetical protein